MDKLWAPWRIKYVSKVKVKGCIFCSAFKKKNDKKNFVVYRSKQSFAILNTFPYNNGHVMIVPNRHVAGLDGLTEREIVDMYKVLKIMIARLRKVIKPAGFNVGINLGRVSGAGIDKHLHMHLVPRWFGDTNFMPVITGTKIISQSLEELYKKISGK